MKPEYAYDRTTDANLPAGPRFEPSLARKAGNIVINTLLLGAGIGALVAAGVQQFTQR